MLNSNVKYKEVLLNPGSYHLSDSSQSQKTYKDLLFAIIYLINLLIIIILGLSTGIKALSVIAPTIITVNSSVTVVKEDSNSFIGGFFLILFIGILLSCLFIVILSRLSSYIIHTSLILTISVMLISGVILFTSGTIIIGLLLTGISAYIIIYYYYLMPYIAFSTVNLKIACKALQSLPTLFITTLVILCGQALFYLFWFLTVVGEATNESTNYINSSGNSYKFSQCSTYKYSNSLVIGNSTLICSAKTCNACICDDTNVVYSSKACYTTRLYYPIYWLLLLSLLWTCSITSNIVNCTVSRSISKWWKDSEIHEYNEVWEALSTSITTSFGSICLGSLFVAILRTLRYMVSFVSYQLKRLHSSNISSRCNAKSIELAVISMVDYMLRVLDNTMEYFNVYAFCFVAIYGYSFIDASRSAVGLFRERGWTAIVNDSIIDSVLFLSHVSIGFICTVISLLYIKEKHLNSVNATILSFLAFYIGHFMSGLVSSMITSAVATIFVCFAEKHEYFESAHPDLYKELLDAWLLSHPNELKNITHIDSNDRDNTSSDESNHNKSKVIIQGKFSNNDDNITSMSEIFGVSSHSINNNDNNTSHYDMSTIGSYLYSEASKTYESLFPSNSSYTNNKYANIPNNNVKNKSNQGRNDITNDEESVYF